MTLTSVIFAGWGTSAASSDDDDTEVSEAGEVGERVGEGECASLEGAGGCTSMWDVRAA